MLSPSTSRTLKHGRHASHGEPANWWISDKATLLLKRPETIHKKKLSTISDYKVTDRPSLSTARNTPALRDHDGTIAYHIRNQTDSLATLTQVRIPSIFRSYLPTPPEEIRASTAFGATKPRTPRITTTADNSRKRSMNILTSKTSRTKGDISEILNHLSIQEARTIKDGGSRLGFMQSLREKYPKTNPFTFTYTTRKNEKIQSVLNNEDIKGVINVPWHSAGKLNRPSILQVGNPSPTHNIATHKDQMTFGNFSNFPLGTTTAHSKARFQRRTISIDNLKKNLQRNYRVIYQMIGHSKRANDLFSEILGNTSDFHKLFFESNDTLRPSLSGDLIDLFLLTPAARQVFMQEREKAFGIHDSKRKTQQAQPQARKMLLFGILDQLSSHQSSISIKEGISNENVNELVYINRKFEEYLLERKKESSLAVVERTSEKARSNMSSLFALIDYASYNKSDQATMDRLVELTNIGQLPKPSGRNIGMDLARLSAETKNHDLIGYLNSQLTPTMDKYLSLMNEQIQFGKIMKELMDPAKKIQRKTLKF